MDKGFWGSMVALNQIVSKAIQAGSLDESTDTLEASNELDVVLQRHRPSFISLLRNPSKNANERTTLQRATLEPILLPGYTLPMKLPESFVQEVMILSDMFELNEISAFSLLKSAEEEKTLYPGIPRGLVAVLFYYDSREQLANAFKTLVQARQGISWTLLPNNEELSCSITQYLDPILNTSVVDRILHLIETMDLTKEIELLQKNRALGNAKHRSMVIEKFKSIRLLLAESLFCWAAQTPLKRDECKRLLAHLSQIQLSETKDGSLDQINLILLISLLCSIDSSYLLAAEDITEAFSQFPLTNDSQFVPEIHTLIRDSDWQCEGLLSILRLAWSVSLAILRQIPFGNQGSDKELFIEEDQLIADKALKHRPFYFIEKSILVDDNLPLDSFYAQRLHNLLTDFICHMFDKVKVMKTIADENARKIAANIREGLDPPLNLEQPYEELLCCLSKLYENGQCGESVDEFWYDHMYSSTSIKSQNMKQIALYRFIRLPGDFLQPSLFVPYLQFMSALATTSKSAQSIYNFLRMEYQPVAQGSNMSWESFLSAFSQYYHNLRLQQPQSMHETVYQSSSRSTLRCISPQELKGLLTVLHLIKNVAKNDESARIAICNNSAFSPIFVFVGLLTCNVPLSFKTWLLKSLGAFCASPSLSGKVWQAIQSAGLVPLVSGTPGYANCGLRQDIEEVESRCEEFPLSQAFLEFLLALVKSGIPYQPGNIADSSFRPYLDLVIKQIFLPHDSRTYRDGNERWALSRMSMQLFLQLLQDYQPPPPSLPRSENWNHPSHILLIELVQDSRVIRQLFSVLHDAVLILEQYNYASIRITLEETLLRLMEVILLAFKLQRNVLVRDANKGENLLMGIDRLLTSMNPRTGSCDHLLNISLVLGHHVMLPRHASLVCQILNIVASSSLGQSHILPLLSSPPSKGLVFRQNFVELLDHAALDEDHIKAAQAALDLLKSCLNVPILNIGHFLLGFFDGNSAGCPELKSDLLEPGVRGFPRTALHAVLACLPTLPSKLSASAYDLIFILTSNPSTSAATLRYLSSHDFVHQSLSNLSLGDAESDPAKLESIGCVLRIAALDLRYHSLHKQRSQLRRLINLLVSSSDPEVDTHIVSSDLSFAWHGLPSSEGRGVLLSLLEMAELTVEVPSLVECQFLTKVSEILKICEESMGSTRLFNVAHLHQLLLQLTRTDSGAVSSPNDPINEEIQNVLDYALSVNQSRRLLSAQKHLLESWRQLMEVVVSVSPTEMTELASHQAFLLTITLELIRKILDETANSELSSILISTLLLLVTTLRTIKFPKVSREDSSSPVSSSLPSSLQLILRGIIDCILRYKHASQSVLASLYAALLNYLRIHVNGSSQARALDNQLSASTETPEEQFHRENYEALRDDLVQIVDIFSYEASAGHLVCRLLSLTCLDAIATLERRSTSILSMESHLLNHLSDQGHLRILIDGISSDDQNMISIIVEGDADIRPLYLWEARASLFSRLCLTPNGCRLLLQYGLLNIISEMQVFKYLPSNIVDPSSFSMETVTPEGSVYKVHSGAISGAVRICMSVLTSLGPEDDSAISQVLFFLSSNVEVLVELMRVPDKGAMLDALSQLALLTAVVSTSSSSPRLFIDQKDPTSLETVVQNKRLRSQLLCLLPHFKGDSRLSRVIEELPLINEDGTCIRERARTFFSHVLTNCLFHAKDILLKGDVKSSDVSLLFQPNLDPLSESSRWSVQSLSLGTLMDLLSYSSQEFVRCRSLKEDALKRLRDIDTAHFDCLHQFVNSTFIASASPSAVRTSAALYLQTVVKEHDKQEQLAVYSTEACMLLLYRHLLHYFNLSKAKLTAPTPGRKPPLSSQEQIEELKSKVRSKFEDSIHRIKQVETLHSSSAGHVPFMEGCITKIKWLLAS